MDYDQCIIREAVFEDIDEILEIEKESNRKKWSREQYLSGFKNTSAQFWVVEMGAMIVGYIGFLKLVDEIEITNIAIKKTEQRKKLGSLLLQKLLLISTSSEVKKIFLEVRKSNIGAQSFYYRFSFQRIGTRKEYYSDNKEDAIIMSLDVPKEVV
jgi:ribosomal-protein-alanine N-acetyltransferase